MIEAFRLFGQLSLQGGAEVQSELESVSQTAENTTVGFGNLGRNLMWLGGIIATGAVALGGLAVATAKVGIGYNAMQEQSSVAWTTLLGDQEKAKKMLEDIANFAAKTPFETEHVDAMAKYMNNAGLAGEKLFNELGKISDVASAFAIPADDAKEMARQMAQVRNAGVAYTEDLNILEDKGVPIMKTIAENLGITTAEAKKMAGEGKITADIYTTAFDTIAKKVEGASDAQSKTFTGMISSISDGAKMLAGTLTEGIFEKAKGFLETVQTILGQLNEGFKEGGFRGALEAVFPEDVANTIIGLVEDFNATLKWIKDNWQLIVSGLTGIVGALVAFQVITTITTALRFFNAMMIAFRTGTILATLAQWGLNTALLANPITWIAIAIGLLIALIVYMALNWETVSKKLTEYFSNVKKRFNEDMEEIKAYFSGVKDRFNQDIESVKRLWAGLKEYWSGVKDRFRADVDSIKAKIEEWKNKIEDMKNSAVTKFESLKNSITTKFNAIKTAIMNPIETAKTAVGRAVDWIKSKFNGLSLKLPNIKTPHFKVKNWSLNPADWVKRRPSIAIDWYKEGGFMDKTTLIGAGEGGAEGIVPLEGKHMLPFAQAIGEYLGQREGATNGLSIEIPLVVNGREIARAIGSDIDHELKRRKDIRKRGV